MGANRFVETHPDVVGYTFELCELRKPDGDTLYYAEVVTEPADPQCPGIVTLDSRLHAWALMHLTSDSYEFGVYAALCHSIDADGCFVKDLASVNILWNGKAVVASGDW